MKRFWFGLLWLAAFAAAGSAAGHRYIPPIPLAFIVVSGAAVTQPSLSSKNRGFPAPAMARPTSSRSA